MPSEQTALRPNIGCNVEIARYSNGKPLFWHKFDKGLIKI